MKPWAYPELGYSAAPRRSKNEKNRTQFHRVTKSIQVLAGEVIEGFMPAGSLRQGISRCTERERTNMRFLCSRSAAKGARHLGNHGASGMSVSVGQSVNDVIVLEPEELGKPGFVVECIATSGRWHRSTWTSAAIEAGRAHCRECAVLNAAHETQRQARQKEQMDLAAGNAYVKSVQ
jgi:hypothetical protein